MQINYDKVAMDYQASRHVDPVAMERLKPLMITMIKRYYPNFKEWDDLMQELRVITLEALLDFDPAHGAHALALIESRMKYHLLGKYKKQVVTTPTRRRIFSRGRDQHGRLRSPILQRHTRWSLQGINIRRRKTHLFKILYRDELRRHRPRTRLFKKHSRKKDKRPTKKVKAPI